MPLNRREFLVAATATALAAPALAPAADRLAKLKQIIAATPAGRWVEIPNTSIMSVLAKRSEAPNDGGVNGPTAVIYSWNGAAYDPASARWYFHGGGHSDYSGNEVYAFDFEGLRWERLTNPSPIKIDGDPGKQSSYHTTDGTPLSSHDYDGIVYCPLTKTLFVWLGSIYPSGGMWNDVWEFDPGRKKWTFVQSLPAGWNHGPPSAKWSEKHKKIVFFTVGTAAWFDPVAKRYTGRGGYFGYTDAGCGAIDDEGDAYYFMSNNIYKVALTEPSPGTGVEIVPGRASERAPNIQSILYFNSGMTWDAKRKLLTIWDGGSGLHTYDPAAGKFGVYPTTGAAPAPVNGHVYSKWHHLRELDVFIGYDNVNQGIWVFKPPDRPAELVPLLGSVVVKNADGSGARTFNTFSEAAKAVKDGQIIEVKRGDHPDGGVVTANHVLIRGADGAHLMDSVQDGGTGILVIKGNDCVVENLEVSGGQGSGNTSSIRFNGKNLVLRKCRLHHSNMNFLSGGDNGNILMEDCVVEDSAPQGEYSHNIYIGENAGGVAASFTMRRCQSLRANGLGHLVKSRAMRTTIEECTLAMFGANSSRCIDVSDGGEVVIRNNVIEVGPKSDNNDAIGIALEYAGNLASHLAGLTVKDASGNLILNPAWVHATTLEKNIIINDRVDGEGRPIAVHSRSPANTVLKDNTFVSPAADSVFGLQDGGAGKIVDGGGNRIVGSRSAAHLPPYPALPSVSKS